ncbi:MAG: hypothetical protein HUN04_03955 [Desulfobacter sp.]|nr:MAG: hypothetical protein HUN04_03955 [Desulfobacter sp.]
MRPDTGFGNFSVLNTSFELLDINGTPCIKKIIRPNTALSEKMAEIKQLTDRYIKQLRKKGIPLPVVEESFNEGDRLIYICHFHGPNIQQNFSLDDLMQGDNDVVEQISKIISLAVQSGLFIDPHPKNFVCDKENVVHYVDFSPPYIQEFMEMREAMAEGEELEIIQKNFSYFGPDYLPFHFVGDFFNIYPEIPESVLSFLYETLSKNVAVRCEFRPFIEQAKKVRALEDLRLAKSIYLM